MYNVLSDIKISKNFKLSEFECHDGHHEVLIDGTLLTLIQKLRDALQCAIFIEAGYRSVTHNRVVGGSPNSQHLIGKAVDIKVTGHSPLAVAILAERIGFKGIGVYTHNGQYFTHLDVRQYKSYWHDNNGKTLTSVKSLKEIKI